VWGEGSRRGFPAPVSTADEALTKLSAGDLVKLLTDKVAKGVQERFQVVLEKKKHAEESVEAGREFVEAYVDFTHFAERLYDDATAPAGHHAGEQQ
jgi:TusA-related sulfurtransferase